MKYLLAGAIALFAFASANTARAADTPLKAPAPIAPAPSWTGFYLGAQLGAAWQDAHTDYGPVAAPFAPVIIFGFASGLIPTSAPQDGAGFLGGLTLGYNMQSGPVVWGLEGDASWLSVRNTSNVTGATVVGIGFTDTTTTETKTDWRPRCGRVRASLFLRNPCFMPPAVWPSAMSRVRPHLRREGPAPLAPITSCVRPDRDRPPVSAGPRAQVSNMRSCRGGRQRSSTCITISAASATASMKSLRVRLQAPQACQTRQQQRRSPVISRGSVST